MPNRLLRPATMLRVCMAVCVFLSVAVYSQQPKKITTVFGTETGEYAVMLKQLEQCMLTATDKSFRTLGGKKRNVFVPWIRDHVHVMKAMKYIDSDLVSFIEFYLENQTPEGIYFDYYYPINAGGINDRMRLFDKRFWKIIPKDSIQLHRLPVEADLEYLLVEGVYAVWQSTGDTAFVQKWLPALLKGINYSMSDPLRWSKKYQLIKRGYTLDTWDFMQLPTSRAEYTRSGQNIQKGIFNIDENTPMGIMHGDNSGLYAACLQLATLYLISGDRSAHDKWQQAAAGIRKRTNDLCWNGKFYAHFIEDDPQPSYLNMDQRNTLSLSNAYDINRGLPTAEMSQSVINTYRKLRESNKQNSFAEWYGIYPAVQPDFSGYKPGSYMNGGVTTIVAGELAKAAFQNGFETYGVDIIRRIGDLINKHQGKLPVSYTPEGKVDEGIPDNWGQAAVYSALIEGLAGVVDKSTQFRRVEVSPRWMAAGKDNAEVSVAYGSTGAYVSYQYRHQPGEKKIELAIKGRIDQATIRLLLPPTAKKAKVFLDNKIILSAIEVVNQSRYVRIDGLKGETINLSFAYK